MSCTLLRSFSISSIVAAAAVALAGSSSAQTEIVGWGDRVFDSRWNAETFTDVSAGTIFTLGLRSNGEIAAWGENSIGVCQPPPAPSPATYVEVSAGHDHGLARLSTGAVVGWGNNLYGKATPPPGTNFVQISAGTDFSLGLRSNGNVSAWGSNNYLQCNVPPLPAGVTYTQISAGNRFALALRSDGAVVGWGHNTSGQCNPPPLPSGVTYVEVGAGLDASYPHGVARRSDGTVVAWGHSGNGQLNVPALPAGVTYVDVEAGAAWTLAKRSDGNVVLWPNSSQLPPLAGANIVELELGTAGVLRQANGQLINFGPNWGCQSNVPALPPGVRYTKVVGTRDDGNPLSYYALASDGKVRAWGSTYLDALQVPALVGGLSYVDVYAGYYGGAALVSDGTLRFWGDTYDGMYGPSLSLPAGVTYVAAELGGSHGVGLRSDGEIVAWGNYNNYGQLNVPPLPAGTRYVALAAGKFHSVALRDDGAIVGWGNNTNGQLNAPALPPGVAYVAVRAHIGDSGALRSDGRFVVWGAHTLAPTPAFGIEAVDLALGGLYGVDLYGTPYDDWFAFSLRDDGSVSPWGTNSFYSHDLPALPAGHAFRDVEASGISGIGVYAPSYGLTSMYCTTSQSTGNCAPLVRGVGQASASSATSFGVEVRGVDGQRSGILFYGVDNAGFSPLVWNPGSTSVLCVKPPTQRTPLQTSTGTTGQCDGAFALDWNAFLASQPTALGAPFAAGDRVYLQCWFRDSGAPGNTNLSNALDVAIWP